MNLPSNSCRLLCSAMARRCCLSRGSSCRARFSAAATAISLALARLSRPPRSPPDGGSEAALAALAPPAPSPPPIGAPAAAPSLAGTLADRPSAGHPASAPPLPPADPAPACVAPVDAAAAAEASGRVPASGAAGADTARADLAAFFWKSPRNSNNFASGIAPSTRPSHVGASCFLKCVVQNTSHPATRLFPHCAPRPSAQIRAKHFVGSMVSGVKRRHSSESARDGPARGSSPAGAWSAAAAPAPVTASSSSASPAAP